MIENRLTFNELESFLSPILQLRSPEQIINELAGVLNERLDSLEAIQEYSRRYDLTYRGFKIHIFGLDCLEANTVYLTLSCKISKKWFHSFKNPSNSFIKELQQICIKNIEELKFRKTKKETNTNTEVLTCIHDRNAYNYDFQQENEFSSLMIVPSINDKYHFVEFIFHPTCYRRLNNKTVLRKDWEQHISDIRINIKNKATEILQFGFKS